jgi:uncharacterized RDD family membrane protein YckC
MFCNYCRAPNPNDAVYCSVCGRTIKLAPDKTEAELPTQGDENTSRIAGVPVLRSLQEQESTATSIDQHGEKKDSKTSIPNIPFVPSLTAESGDHKLSSNPDEVTAPTVGQSESLPITHAAVYSEPDSSTLTSASGASLALPVYGTMGQRFIAYFADLIVVYLIVIAVYFFSAAIQLPLSASEDESKLLAFIALFVYMIVAQTAYHTTIGKYVHSLEVCSERPNRKYPAFWRILVRETVGRILSSLFWGAGYWFAIKKSKKQAWSDELAGTVVTTRPTNRVLVRAFTGFVFVAFVLDVGIIGYGLYKEEKDKKYAALTKEIESVTKDVIASRQAVDQKMDETKPVNDWADFLLWQDRMKSLKQDLDRYENQIDRMQGLLQRGITEGLAASETERNQLVKLRQVYDIRRGQAEKLRQESDLVTNCDGKRASMVSLRTDLELLDSDIQGLEHRASQLLAEIGIK